MSPKSKLQDIRDPSFPRGSLLKGLLDREIMTQADRGNASAMIGQRWADTVSHHLESLPGTEMPIPGSARSYRLDHVVRLDDDPSISLRASKNGLQNPDFLFVGFSDEATIVQAADAKFSVETARSKQVSEEVVSALFESSIADEKLVCGDLTDCEHVPGLFLCPDGFLTQHVLAKRRGIRKLTVGRDEIDLIPAASRQMFEGLEGFDVSARFWQLDGHRHDPLSHLGVGLYYFRLTRAAVANWHDENRPLFALSSEKTFDPAEFRQEVEVRTACSKYSWQLVRRWSTDADHVRKQRQDVNNALRLPVSNARLREIVEAEAEIQGVEPPSLNRVRRRLAIWTKQRVFEEIGVLTPPVYDLEAELDTIKHIVRDLKQPILSEIGAAVASVTANSK